MDKNKKPQIDVDDKCSFTLLLPPAHGLLGGKRFLDYNIDCLQSNRV